MPLVVGVTFRRVGKVYYFDPGDLKLREGDFVIAETARGEEFGEVVVEPRHIPDDQLVAPLKRVTRIATGDDLEREAANREEEKRAFEVCERKIADHKLPMKLLDAEYAFDGSQVTFSFSADGRVDFRDLVKDLASTLRIKVQLHQIGVRDEAKLVGGYGPCGRSLCCATFLSSFEPVSMKMAKDQSLFLNPAKFSGACGKLMCCLRYEHEFYKEAQKYLPAVGAIVPTPSGRAKVVDVNVVTGMLTVQVEEDVQLHIHASQLQLDGLCRKHGIACNMSESNCEPLMSDKDNELFTPPRQGTLDRLESILPDTDDDEPVEEPVEQPPSREKPGPQRGAADGVQWRTPRQSSSQPSEQKPDDRGRRSGGNGRGRKNSARSNNAQAKENSNSRPKRQNGSRNRRGRRRPPNAKSGSGDR